MPNTPNPNQERIAWTLKKSIERILSGKEAAPTDDLETAVTNAVLAAVNQEGDNLTFVSFRNIITQAISHLRIIEKNFDSPEFSLPELHDFKVGDYVTLRAGTVFENAARPNADFVAQVRVYERYTLGGDTSDDALKVDRVGVYVEGLSVMIWLPGNTAALPADKPEGQDGFYVLLESDNPPKREYLPSVFKIAEINEDALFLVEHDENEFFQEEPSATYNEAYGWEFSQDAQRRYHISQKVWEQIVVEATRSEP